MLNRNQKGFTLIELLIVVAIIGIIAAIAIPNLLNAIDRGKQKRTMADLRSMGTAIESYAVDANVYPVASDVATLAGTVEPIYIKNLPEQDGWRYDFQVNSATTIRSSISVKPFWFRFNMFSGLLEWVRPGWSNVDARGFALPGRELCRVLSSFLPLPLPATARSMPGVVAPDRAR